MPSAQGIFIWARGMFRIINPLLEIETLGAVKGSRVKWISHEIQNQNI